MTLDQVKNGLSLLGILVAVVGVALDSRLVVWIAIGVLGAAIVLRIVLRRVKTSSDSPSGTESR